MLLDDHMKIPGSRTITRALKQITQRGIILMYHRVSDVSDGTDPWSLCVSPTHFEEHLQVLSRQAHAIPLAHLTQSFKRTRKRQVAITFDDGYADNFYNARPLLEKYGHPAVFFIVSGAIDSQREFWWDELEQIILMSDRLPHTFDLTIGKTKHHWDIQTTTDRCKLYSALWEILSKLGGSQRREALLHVAQWANHLFCSRKSHLPMSSYELRSLAKGALFEIGAHTVSHPWLSRLPALEQEQEIANSKQYLEDLTNKPVHRFSYPHGDQSDETWKIVQRLKFSSACTVVQEAVMPNTNPLLLPRFTVSNWNGLDFEKNLLNWLTQNYET